MEGATENGIYSRSSRTDIVYRCEFPIEPEMLYYYYSPPNASTYNGNLRLEGSPEFTGPGNTNWQVAMTINRWIGTQRWLSLYLTRVDNEPIPYLQVQCEFRIVNKDGTVLVSKRNLLSATNGAETRGFSNFLPFKEFPKMIDADHLLRVEAHLIFIQPIAAEPVPVAKNEDGAPAAEPVPPTQKEQEPDPVSIPKETLSSSNVSAKVPPFITPLIDKEDQVEVYFEGNFVAYTSRSLLLEKSESYKEWVSNGKPSIRDKLEFVEAANMSLRAVQQCLQYLHEDICEDLMSGSYDNCMGLFMFAEFLKIPTLMAATLNIMSSNVSVEKAAEHAELIAVHNTLLSDDAVQNFRKHFRENLMDIRKTASFKEIVKDQQFANYFLRLAVDPFFTFESNGFGLDGVDMDDMDEMDFEEGDPDDDQVEGDVEETD